MDNQAIQIVLGQFVEENANLRILLEKKRLENEKLKAELEVKKEGK